MTFQEILEKLKSKFEILESKEDLGILNANVKPGDIRSVIIMLKEELGFDQLSFVSAIDWIENTIVEAVYQLCTTHSADKVVIRVKLERNKPEIETICDIFKTAEWHERETFEMFGINFLNHPDMTKLLLPDDVDKPLLKDFEHEDFEKLPKI